MPGESRAAKMVEAAEQFGAKEFTAADLTVVAWTADKQAFGLRGFENLYPDSKTVAVELARKDRGVARRIQRVRTGVYRLQPIGRGG